MGVKRMSDTVESANTISVKGTEASGNSTESGSEVARLSRSGSGTTRGRRSAMVTTPPDPGPPSFDVEADELLGDKKKMYAVLKKNLMVSYLEAVQQSKDMSVAPHHRLAARKQAKELAELLARLVHDSKE